MPQLRKILFPVDFSARCARMALSAGNVAEHFKARLTVLHAIGAAPITQVAYPIELYAAWRKQLRESSVVAMDKFVHRYLNEFRVNRVIEEGDPAQIIVDHAQEKKIDLIMMPTHGSGIFHQFLIGSVTAKVLHDAQCPVWTSVHTKQATRRTVGDYKNILCAVDRGSAAVPLIRWAAWMTRRYNATLKLVHVMAALDEISQNRGEVELRRYLSDRAQNEFSVLMDQAGCQCELLLRGGSIPARLAETAKQQRSDLLIIGRGHMKKNLGRLRTNSLAIVRESPCPVISV